jgi:transcriptional regulator with XRE-family HTH domain
MVQNVMDNVRNNMKKLRKELNMSQETIASKLNIVRPVISNWERGKGEPSTSQLVNLAQVLGVSVDTLVKNEDEGKQVVVVDTSILIKRPAIIKEMSLFQNP